MTEPHSRRLPVAGRDDGRSAMTIAGDGPPPRSYDPSRGREEPPAVTAARERHQAVSARIEAAKAALTAGHPGAHGTQEDDRGD